MAKRRHRTIVEHGLTLLAYALMPMKYWDEAFRAIVYLNNRLPISILHHKTSLKVLFKTLPDYSFLKIFGCFYFPNICSYNKYKLQFRSTECTFLGYSFNHKGYKCLDSIGKIIISRDVISMSLHFLLLIKFNHLYIILFHPLFILLLLPQ